jgi:hypothetical protein
MNEKKEKRKREEGRKEARVGGGVKENDDTTFP